MSEPYSDGMRKRRRQSGVSSSRAWLTATLVGVLAIGVGGLAFASLRTAAPTTGAANYTAPPAPVEEERPTALFFGDSYSAGTGASTPRQRWTTLVAANEGWDERNYARGGTGFVSTATAAGCGEEFCPAYIGMIDQAVADQVSPTVVFIAGGQNDTDEWFQGDDGQIVRDAISATYVRARDAFPGARIISVGPSWLGEPASWQDDFEAAVRDAASSVGAEFISLRNPPALNDPAMELGDGGHVNDLGHRAIADRVIGQITRP